jgi:hypothetical protein
MKYKNWLYTDLKNYWSEYSTDRESVFYFNSVAGNEFCKTVFVYYKKLKPIILSVWLSEEGHFYFYFGIESLECKKSEKTFPHILGKNLAL